MSADARHRSPVSYPSEKSGVDDRSEQFGTDVYRNEVEPILTRYFAAKMHASMRADDQSERNQEALDLLSEAKVLTLKKLGGGGAIDDLAAYVRTVAANVFNQHLRRRHPHRLRVKNQCRYLLTHDPRYAIWRDDRNDLVCGPASAEGSAAQRGPLLSPEECSAIRARVVTKDETAAIIDIVGAMLGDRQRVAALDDLVSAVCEVQQIVEAVEVPDDEGSVPEASSEKPSALDVIEEREFVGRLWRGVLTLPVRHRVALLLNFRGDDGEELTSLLATCGAASVRDIARALEIDEERFAEMWSELPWDDRRIASHLGIERQQVINLRQSAKQKLRREIR
jgi:DNA-directed RNA polymerase specialized sigma24 family protein